MGISTETYSARIGTFVIEYRKEHTTRTCEVVVMGNQIWFLGLVIRVVLVIGGAEFITDLQPTN
jgi:hypothetical protein